MFVGRDLDSIFHTWKVLRRKAKLYRVGIISLQFSFVIARLASLVSSSLVLSFVYLVFSVFRILCLASLVASGFRILRFYFMFHVFYLSHCASVVSRVLPVSRLSRLVFLAFGIFRVL